MVSQTSGAGRAALPSPGPSVLQLNLWLCVHSAERDANCRTKILFSPGLRGERGFPGHTPAVVFSASLVS